MDICTSMGKKEANHEVGALCPASITRRRGLSKVAIGLCHRVLEMLCSSSVARRAFAEGL